MVELQQNIPRSNSHSSITPSLLHSLSRIALMPSLSPTHSTCPAQPNQIKKKRKIPCLLAIIPCMTALGRNLISQEEASPKPLEVTATPEGAISITVAIATRQSEASHARSTVRLPPCVWSRQLRHVWFRYQSATRPLDASRNAFVSAFSPPCGGRPCYSDQGGDHSYGNEDVGEYLLHGI